MVWSGNKAPSQESEDGRALAAFVEDELERFANEQLDNLQAIDLRPIYNEPLRPRQGMIAYADGSSWNPGFGEGPYYRNSAGLWVRMGLAVETLYAARTYFVDVTLGNDANTGLVAGAGGALQTIQAAINKVHGLFLNGFDVTIQLAAGTYTSGASVTAPWFGKGAVTLLGDTTTPSNCTINPTNNHVIYVEGFASKLNISGLRISTTTSGNGLYAYKGGTITLVGKCDFFAIAGQGCRAESLGQISFETGAINVGGSLGSIFLLANNGGRLSNVLSVTFTWLSNTTGTFCQATTQGFVSMVASTFTLGAFTHTGTRYAASNLGLINSGGGGAAYFPGTVAGTGTNPGVAPWGLYL